MNNDNMPDGLPVYWYDNPHGGYSSFSPVLALLVGETAKRMRILPLMKSGWATKTRLVPKDSVRYLATDQQRVFWCAAAERY